MGELKSSLIYGILKDSVCEGRTKTLQHLLDKGFDVNHEYPDGATLLHYACDNKQQQCIQILLQNGAKVNKTDKDGRTALDIGIYQDDSELWKNFLIFNPNNENLKKYLTIEHLIKFFQFLEDVKKNTIGVLTKLSTLNSEDLRIIMNMQDKEGNSLLLSAFANKHEKIAYKLMKLVTKQMVTGFQLDHLEKIKNVVSQMVGGLDFIGYDFSNMKYFSIILDNKNLNILTAFLTVIETKLQEAYADLLLKACEENCIEKVKKSIIRARNNLNKNVSMQGMAFDIKYALEEELKLNNKNFPAIKMILFQYASREVLCRFVINARTTNGSTPLQIAAKNDNVKIVKLLLKYGACLYVKLEPITVKKGQKSYCFLNDMHEFFDLKGANINKYELNSDKFALTNAIGQFGYPVWFLYMGQPNDELKLKLLDLIEIDDEVLEQNFIL